MSTKVDCIRFNQFSLGDDRDELIIFSAPARVLEKWAGIPRKGWSIRMLFQRQITELRKRELTQFWNNASNPEIPILGPTAITIAIQGQAKFDGNKIELDYTSPILPSDSNYEALEKLAIVVLPKVVDRLSPEQQLAIDEFSNAPFQKFPDVEHDYVFEFALQLVQMKANSKDFCARNSIKQEEQNELIIALESICRPALVVDGQHRLIGAANAEHEITLPVVAIPNCEWAGQVYQFVVINEKAQSVPSSLLTDIFGSSLTKNEQQSLRDKLSRAKIDVEGRIAATIANRDENSPFKNLVQVQMSGQPPSTVKPFITDSTIRMMIDGGGRGARAWRVDDEFFEVFVKPTFPERGEWESWSNGKWREYWYTFWHTVKDFYNEQAMSLVGTKLWPSGDVTNGQSNLTRAVTLRVLQSYFMERCIDGMKTISDMKKVLREALGDEDAEIQIEKQVRKRALPDNQEQFKQFVIDNFLENGIPVRVFTTPWENSLDDQEGISKVKEELERAWEFTNNPDKIYRLRKNSIFVFDGK